MGAVAAERAVLPEDCEFFDFIQHEYAVRYRNPANGAYAFHTLIKRRTRYPHWTHINTDHQSSFVQQSLLGWQLRISSQSSFHLVTLKSCSTKMVKSGFSDRTRRNDSHLFYWMNEQTPSFLVAIH